MVSEMIKVRALRTQQGKNTVFSFFLSAGDVLRISDISRIERDSEGELKGLQRKPIQRHIAGIVEYLNQPDVIFPNAIILALDPTVEFKQSRGPLPEGVDDVGDAGIIELPLLEEGKRAAWIVDGQQRSTALAKINNTTLKVPVVGFICPDIETQRQQFILVNKAKPLPRRLIDELLPEIGSPMPSDLSPRRVPSEIVNALTTTEGSPLYGLIKRPSDPEGSTGIIIDSAFIKIAETSLKNYGALAMLKGSNRGQYDLNGMYFIMTSFWSAVKRAFPEAWGLPPTESRLMHSAGIQALGVLMDRMVPRYKQDNDFENNLVVALTKIAPQCAWTEGEWQGIGLRWNEVQSVPRHIRLLAEHLVQIDYIASQEKK